MAAFLDVPLAISIGNAVCSATPHALSLILVEVPPLEEGVRAGGVNAPIFPSQSLHQAWAKRRMEHRSLLWVLEVPSLHFFFFFSFQW